MNKPEPEEKRERHPVAVHCECGREPVITTDSQGVATVRCDHCGKSTSGWTRRDAVNGWNEANAGGDAHGNR